MSMFTLPLPVMQKLTEEAAKEVRDSVNTYFGYERLTIATLQPTPSQSTSIVLFKDAEASEDERVYLEWEPDIDVSLAIELIINGLDALEETAS